jgi:hypothetical protein
VFEPLEVWGVDVVMSTGEGRPRPTDLRTTVYRRQVDQKHGLKVKASRQFFNEVNRRYPTLPFSLRYLDGEMEAIGRMGVRECANHGLLATYPVVAERPGDAVAHIKFTVLLLPGGTIRVAGLDLPPDVFVAPAGPLPEDLNALLIDEEALAAERKRQKKKEAAARKKKDATAKTETEGK